MCSDSYVRLQGMGWWLSQGSVLRSLRVSDLLSETGEITASTPSPQQARKAVALKPA